ncbi:di-heme oxidoredictase family protein [Crateriforma conspicua]|uniref:Cytochrome c domain-containing protein n=1 Tax=Crateriforma conspicua TaxID=2527996 RepID=A0A5C6FNI7_9PLAN|nr:di-heme oxidoredictase family protein [Crateriforma conspicua]TWU62979.1 hypothetical protein V7x_47160 [Crateriforma conspicua]
MWHKRFLCGHASVCRWLVLFGGLVVAPEIVSAVTPQDVATGRLLFEKQWQSSNPAMGSDGLGPLFNATSCVGCHHQGGVGGGGDSRFNANSIGLDAIKLSANALRSDVQRMVRTLHPSLVDSSGNLQATATLPHFGGTLPMRSLRQRYVAHSSSEFAAEGGAATPADVRENMTASWKWKGVTAKTGMEIEARIFQRNTTALFGAGLIDQVPDSDLERQVAIQRRHPEVSGRLSILRDNTYGRFGWRGNLSRLADFVDQACANEMGLQTKRREQPTDLGMPDYRNPGIDIREDQVLQVRDFIAALPRPVRAKPRSSEHASEIVLGERVFNKIGCNACHVKDMGPATELYSDLLLHDMGDRLYDYDAAEPDVVRAELIRQVVAIGAATETSGYRGRSVSLASSPTPILTREPVYQRTPRRSNALRDTVVIQPGQRFTRVRIINPGSCEQRNIHTPMQEQMAYRRTLRPSNVTQEWRTPPLWGVADSAPYMHDGRAETLAESIAMHGGEATGSRDRYLNLGFAQREALQTFLKSLIAPPTAPQPTTLAASR